MLKTILNKLFWGVFRHFLSDRQYAVCRYWLEFDRFPDLDNPKRFTEKVQYLKLYERTALRKTAGDRIAVRNYITQKIGEDHLIPLLGNFEELSPSAWNSLPSSFVLKANHGCKMVEIVEEKSKRSYPEIRDRTQKWQSINYYKFGREWVYKDVPRTIVAEELLQDDEGTIPEDYKFFCFHGRAEFIQIDFDRFIDHSRNFYDRDFNLLPFTVMHPQYSEPVPKPPILDEAINVAETLSADFNFMRVDLFLHDDNIYFGELTNFPNNGFTKFSPERIDLELGQKLDLKKD